MQPPKVLNAIVFVRSVSDLDDLHCLAPLEVRGSDDFERMSKEITLPGNSTGSYFSFSVSHIS